MSGGTRISELGERGVKAKMGECRACIENRDWEFPFFPLPLEVPLPAIDIYHQRIDIEDK